MRALLFATLLTASTARAETYICKPEAVTGLMMLENSYLVVDYSKLKKLDAFVVSRPTFSVPDTATTLTLSNTKGENIYDCNVTGETRNSVLVCIDKWNTMVFRLDTTNGKYVQTDSTRTVKADGYERTPYPQLQAGSCDLFKQ